jgi:hypothetical protein
LHTATALAIVHFTCVAEPGGSGFSKPDLSRKPCSPFLYHGGRDDPPLGSVYTSKSDAELSWTQAEPATSLALIEGVLGRQRHRRGRRDVAAGRGCSDRGYAVTVLDISRGGDRSRAPAAGNRASQVAGWWRM